MPKVLKSNCRKLWCLSVCKKLTSSQIYSLRYCKDIANFLFWLTFMLVYMQKKTSSLASFLRYCKEIAKLLFWEIWTCLSQTPKMIVSILKKSLTIISRQKVIFILHFSMRYCKNIANFPWDIAKILLTCYFGYFGHI